MIATLPEAAAPEPELQHSRLQEFFKDRRAVVGLVIFGFFARMGLLAPLISPYSPTTTSFPPMLAPSPAHWLGTTGNGQDILSQLIWGTRTSLAIGLGAGLISTAIAVLIGLMAGYRGGPLDTVLVTMTNIVLVIPGLPRIIVVAAYARSTGPATIALVIGLTGWAFGARILRSQALSLAQRDYVIAAKLARASDWYVLFSEILPNMLSLVVANLMFASLYATLADAGLEFLGLGNVNAVSWGTMLYWADAGHALLHSAWWWFVPPGLTIALVGASFALLNFSIDHYSHPRLRRK